MPAAIDETAVARQRLIDGLMPELSAVIRRMDRAQAVWAVRDLDRLEREMEELGLEVERYIEAVEG